MRKRSGLLSVSIYPVISILIVCFSCQANAPIELPSPVILEAGDWPGWEEEETIERGFIEVPEDHSDPAGKKIKVAFAKFKSKSPSPSPIPIIALTGGPGGRALNGPGRWDGAHFLDDRDLIVIEQRGIGLSSPLVESSEGFVNILAANYSSEEERSAVKKLIDDIRAEMQAKGQDPSKYNTIQNAHDVGALMSALGYDKYSLSGGSYGTKLGMYVMKYYPEKIHSSILNAPATLDGKALENRIPDFVRSLNLLFEECAKDPTCSIAHADLKNEMLSAFDALHENPITVELVNRPYCINPQDAMYFLRYLLYRAEGFELAPAFVKALNERDTAAIKTIAFIPSQMLYVGNMTAFMAFQAYEEYSEETPMNFEKAMSNTPELGPGFAWFQSIVPEIGNLHNERITPQEHELKNITPPSLVIVNEFDPVTPPENTILFEKALSKPTVLRLNRFGHGSGGDCVNQIVKDFLANPNNQLDLSCLNE